jgi:hypothetical protein
MRDKNENNKSSEKSLDTAYATLKHQNQVGPDQPPGGYRSPQSEFGIPSECITHLGIVGEKLGGKIREGKDINVAKLLIHKYETEKHNNKTNNMFKCEDPRLQHQLNIV